jgi:hypothetical protein
MCIGRWCKGETMQERKLPKGTVQISTKPARRVFSQGRILAAFFAAGVVLLAAAQTQQNGEQSSSSQPQGQPTPDRAWTTTAQIGFSDPQAEKPNANAANSERKKQLSEDSEKLLKLATDLKAEVDKTTKDTLSISVIRKADEIEKLAHSVKEKMKVSPAGN